MNLYGILQSETSDLSVSLYVTRENNLHFWVRAGIALIGIESIEDIDDLIELLQAAKREAVRFEQDGEESNVH